MIRVNNAIYVAKADYDDRLVDRLNAIVERRRGMSKQTRGEQTIADPNSKP